MAKSCIRLTIQMNFLFFPRKPMSTTEPDHLYQDPIPITESKYVHLQELKDVIEKDHHTFYANLPYKKDKEKGKNRKETTPEPETTVIYKKDQGNGLKIKETSPEAEPTKIYRKDKERGKKRKN